MTTRDDYMSVARQIADYMNAFGLAFKTYSVAELDSMIKILAGEGARISTDTAAQNFEQALLERGFVAFPSLVKSSEGHTRIYRASSLIGNLLSIFRYPGSHGDNELARLLRTLQNRRRADNLEINEAES